jgi:hypothetical protein
MENPCNNPSIIQFHLISAFPFQPATMPGVGTTKNTDV